MNITLKWSFCVFFLFFSLLIHLQALTLKKHIIIPMTVVFSLKRCLLFKPRLFQNPAFCDCWVCVPKMWRPLRSLKFSHQRSHEHLKTLPLLQQLRHDLKNGRLTCIYMTQSIDWSHFRIRKELQVTTDMFVTIIKLSGRAANRLTCLIIWVFTLLNQYFFSLRHPERVKPESLNL